MVRSLSKREQALKVFAENPSVSNKDLADKIDVTEDYARKITQRLNRAGYIEINKVNGSREITVLKTFPEKTINYKESIAKEMIEGLLIRFDETDDDDKAIKLANEIAKFMKLL